MNKKELLELPDSEWQEEIPLLDEIYVVSTRRKHESGYKMLDVYGVAITNGEISYAKKISGCSDVIDFKMPPIMGKYANDSYFKEYGVRLMCVDYEDVNVARYFLFMNDYKFKVESAWLSSCCIQVVKAV